MICAEKQFFVHTLATKTCRTVVIGIASAILEHFVFAIGSWVIIGRANDKQGEGRGERFFADAQNDKKQHNSFFCAPLRTGVNAGERLF